MIELSQWEYLNIFADDIKYMFLAIPTARNLLYYLCDADFDAVGIPLGARKVLRAECLRRVVVACGKQERQAVRKGDGAGSALSARISKSSLETFKEQVQKLRLFLAENNNVYPTQRDSDGIMLAGGKRERVSSTSALFVKKLRAIYKKGKLCQERVNLLKSLPSWTFAPQADRWTEMHDAARDLLLRWQAGLAVGEHVTYPSKSSLTRFQRKLGCWLANQCQEHCSENTMSVRAKETTARRLT